MTFQEENKTFEDLGLHPKILKALIESGYTKPTPIQEQAIPKILEGLDLRASAQTGTGKTAAFVLPAIQKILEPNAKSDSTRRVRGPKILVLSPTRELALQIESQAKKYTKYIPGIKTVCVFGGVPYPTQIQDLSRPYDILVATPGRLIDHLDRGRIDLSGLQMLILDEADRLLDMGFIEPVEQIAAMTPKTRQTLMFSATLKGSVMNLSKRLLKDPVEVTIEQDLTEVDNIEQRLHLVDNITHKHQLLDHLLQDPEINSVIVFTSTKVLADELVDRLYDKGHKAQALHGNMNQRQRTRTITDMRQGRVRILVATDVAARGIDINTITHVINFDLPSNVEEYLHRIGRTGRAGAKGIALSFAANKDLQLVKRIEQFTGKTITPHVVIGLEPTFKKNSKQPVPRGRSFKRKTFSRR